MELESSEYTIGLLEQVGLYMDSIDANRKWIQINLETGLSREDYLSRIKNLNAYVQKAEWTIGELEKTRSAYASQVKRLKNEITQKDQEIEKLQLAVATYKNSDAELRSMLNITESQLLEAQLDIDVLKSDLKLSEAILEKAHLSEAEALFSQGESSQELAKHIQFAPRRKKKALDDALQYYQASLDMGYGPANAKVDELNKKLGKN